MENEILQALLKIEEAINFIGIGIVLELAIIGAIIGVYALTKK